MHPEPEFQLHDDTPILDFWNAWAAKCGLAGVHRIYLQPLVIVLGNHDLLLETPFYRKKRPMASLKASNGMPAKDAHVNQLSRTSSSIHFEPPGMLSIDTPQYRMAWQKYVLQDPSFVNQPIAITMRPVTFLRVSAFDAQGQPIPSSLPDNPSAALVSGIRLLRLLDYIMGTFEELDVEERIQCVNSIYSERPNFGENEITFGDLAQVYQRKIPSANVNVLHPTRDELMPPDMEISEFWKEWQQEPDSPVKDLNAWPDRLATLRFVFGQEGPWPQYTGRDSANCELRPRESTRELEQRRQRSKSSESLDHNAVVESSIQTQTMHSASARDALLSHDGSHSLRQRFVAS